VLPGRDADP